MPDRPDPAAVTSWPNPDPGRGALGELVTPARLQEFSAPAASRWSVLQRIPAGPATWWPVAPGRDSAAR